MAYMPILKGKEGEFAALETLAPEVCGQITPLVEVPAIPYDYVNDAPAKSLDAHVAPFAQRLRRAWPTDQRIYIDVPWFGDTETVANGQTAFQVILDQCRAAHFMVTPVVSTASSDACLAAVRRHLATTATGVCLRMRVGDFDEEKDPPEDIRRLLHALGISESMVDVLIDLESLEADPSRNVLVARSVMSMLTRPIGGWRSIAVGGSSFPSDLSEIDASSIGHLPRLEWTLFTTLSRKPDLLPAPNVIFADYAIAHPVPTELDPRTMRMSASIRYTAQDDWLVVKGRNVRQYGFEQYYDLCQTLAARPEFSGADFSWGDRYIADCARRMVGTGNATTWRKVGTNHHITFVVRSLIAM